MICRVRYIRNSFDKPAEGEARDLFDGPVSQASTALALLMIATTLGVRAESSASGDPGASSAHGSKLPVDQAELNRLDSRGAQGKVQAAAEGRRLGPGDMEIVNRYNSLLGQYLGARCHV